MTVYEFIKSEENSYITPVNIRDTYDWSMPEHITKTILYRDSQYLSGKDDNKPFKNIIRPILNIEYRATGFDVKDVLIYINDQYKYFKSFLVRKFHEMWARENGIDTFIDKLVETYCAFGGVLVKDAGDGVPEVVPWETVAFCDQTDVLAGPISIKHFYSPTELEKMSSKGWKNLDEAIAGAVKFKKNETNQQIKTPGKYIEVYETYGVFPDYWLTEETQGDEDSYSLQLHITACNRKDDGTKQGIDLYSGKLKELPFKFLARDPIHGRALGMGGAEELFESQVWTNYGMIRMKDLLDAASKIVFQTTDSTLATRNNLKNLENLQIIDVADGKNISQINTTPINIRVFENAVSEWAAHAQQTGAANDSIMGVQPVSGTPARLQELVTAESHSLHEYRKGKIAVFVEEIYREWIIPALASEITKGQEFLSELNFDELQEISDKITECEVQRAVKEKILNGEIFYPDEVEAYRARVKDEFMKAGNKRFLEILKGEFKNVEMSVEVSVAGKQKNLANYADQIVRVLQLVLPNPQMLQNPGLAKLFDEILESWGLSPLDFSSFMKNQPMQLPQPVAQPNQPQYAATG